MRDAYAHCEALVRRAEKDRYLAALFLPAVARRHAFALFAFGHELAQIRGRAREPIAGEIRLQWWCDAVAGEAEGAPANPVAAAMVDTIDRYGLPRAAFVRTIEAHAFDLYDDPMADLATLKAYLETTEGSLFGWTAQMLAGRSVNETTAVRSAGIASGLVRLLRRLPAHAARGQLYLPVELLGRHGVEYESILRGQGGRPLNDALRELRSVARRELELTRRAVAEMPAPVTPAFLPLALVEPYLEWMDRAGYDPFRTPVDVPQWRRQWALWRAARRRL